MSQRPERIRLDDGEPGFDLAQATRAPLPRQVAMPLPNGNIRPEPGRLRMLLDIGGNVVVGAALLGMLLAAPLVLGRLLGLG